MLLEAVLFYRAREHQADFKKSFQFRWFSLLDEMSPKPIILPPYWIFSLSGWAMPFLQRRPGLWQMLRLSPRTESPRSVCLRRGRRKENIPGIPAAAPISRPGLGPAAPCHPASAEPTPSPAGPAAGWEPAPGPRSPRGTHGVASRPSERSASCNVFSRKELSASDTFRQDTFYRVCAKI